MRRVEVEKLFEQEFGDTTLHLSIGKAKAIGAEVRVVAFNGQITAKVNRFFRELQIIGN